MSANLPTSSSKANVSATTPFAKLVLIGLLIVAFVSLIELAPFNNLPPVSQPVANCETPLIRPPVTVSGASTLGN